MRSVRSRNEADCHERGADRRRSAIVGGVDEGIRK